MKKLTNKAWRGVMMERLKVGLRNILCSGVCREVGLTWNPGEIESPTPPLKHGNGSDEKVGAEIAVGSINSQNCMEMAWNASEIPTIPINPKTSDQKNNGGIGGLFGPGPGGFGIPAWGNGIIGGGYGAGVGGPYGGYSRGDVISPSVVCKEKGPCFTKRLACPAKCFSSFSSSGNGYGGGCTVDCKKKCIAYC
ncbi:PAP-specific phosphatase HAL2-like [Hibiscus syriacus]|uniref:PAP-specific phosphatase HAL2-like n=1 Tax=Hibiscus syriacus TaxID=106335 RepID=A0A6A3B1B7_HIBSY|nr:PAP-specific phosphatase HAL2-like [Hibiscus syriacus]